MPGFIIKSGGEWFAPLGVQGLRGPDGANTAARLYRRATSDEVREALMNGTFRDDDRAYGKAGHYTEREDEKEAFAGGWEAFVPGAAGDADWMNETAFRVFGREALRRLKDKQTRRAEAARSR